ncbi:MAG: hemagglutinin repeat-containing protein, partial [Gammaproteobacteria bacterium]
MSYPVRLGLEDFRQRFSKIEKDTQALLEAQMPTDEFKLTDYLEYALRLGYENTARKCISLGGNLYSALNRIYALEDPRFQILLDNVKNLREVISPEKDKEYFWSLGYLIRLDLDFRVDWDYLIKAFDREDFKKSGNLLDGFKKVLDGSGGLELAKYLHKTIGFLNQEGDFQSKFEYFKPLLEAFKKHYDSVLNNKNLNFLEKLKALKASSKDRKLGGNNFENLLKAFVVHAEKEDLNLIQTIMKFIRGNKVLMHELLSTANFHGCSQVNLELLKTMDPDYISRDEFSIRVMAQNGWVELFQYFVALKEINVDYQISSLRHLLKVRICEIHPFFKNLMLWHIYAEEHPEIGGYIKEAMQKGYLFEKHSLIGFEGDEKEKIRAFNKEWRKKLCFSQLKTKINKLDLDRALGAGANPADLWPDVLAQGNVSLIKHWVSEHAYNGEGLNPEMLLMDKCRYLAAIEYCLAEPKISRSVKAPILKALMDDSEYYPEYAEVLEALYSSYPEIAKQVESLNPKLKPITHPDRPNILHELIFEKDDPLEVRRIVRIFAHQDKKALNAKTAHGHSALDLACEKKRELSAIMLLAQGAKFNLSQAKALPGQAKTLYDLTQKLDKTLPGVAAYCKNLLEKAALREIKITEISAAVSPAAGTPSSASSASAAPKPIKAKLKLKRDPKTGQIQGSYYEPSLGAELSFGCDPIHMAFPCLGSKTGAVELKFSPQGHLQLENIQGEFDLELEGFSKIGMKNIDLNGDLNFVSQEKSSSLKEIRMGLKPEITPSNLYCQAKNVRVNHIRGALKQLKVENSLEVRNTVKLKLYAGSSEKDISLITRDARFVAGEAMDLDTGALDNSKGHIESQLLNIKSSSEIQNCQGTLLAGKNLNVAAQGLINNQGGQIMGLHQADVEVTSDLKILNNNGGWIGPQDSNSLRRKEDGVLFLDAPRIQSTEDSVISPGFLIHVQTNHCELNNPLISTVIGVHSQHLNKQAGFLGSEVTVALKSKFKIEKPILAKNWTEITAKTIENHSSVAASDVKLHTQEKHKKAVRNYGFIKTAPKGQFLVNGHGFSNEVILNPAKNKILKRARVKVGQFDFKGQHLYLNAPIQAAQNFMSHEYLETLVYNAHSFKINGMTHLRFMNGRSFKQLLKNTGSFYFDLSVAATKPFDFQANIEAGRKLHSSAAAASEKAPASHVVIKSPSQPVNLGDDLKKILREISCTGVIDIQAKSIQCLLARFVSQEGTFFVSSSKIHLGRVVPVAGDSYGWGGYQNYASDAQTTILTNGPLKMTAPDGVVTSYVKARAQSLEINSPTWDNVGSDIFVKKNARLNVKDILHRMLIQNRTNGSTNRYLPESEHSKLTVQGMVQVNPDTKIKVIASKIAALEWSGKEPDVSQGTVQSTYEVMEPQYRKKKHTFHSATQELCGYQNKTINTTVYYSTLNLGTEFKMSEDIPLLDFSGTNVVAPSFDFSNFDKMIVGINNTWIKLSPPKPFKAVYKASESLDSLAMEMEEDDSEDAPAFFRSILPRAGSLRLPDPVIVGPHGIIEVGSQAIKFLLDTTLELEIFRQAYEEAKGFAFNGKNKSMDEAYVQALEAGKRWKEKNKEAFSSKDLAKNLASFSEVIDEDMILYTFKMVQDSRTGEFKERAEMNFIPAKKLDNPKLRDGAGGLFALLGGAKIRGKSKESSKFLATGHLYAPYGVFAFSELSELEIKKRFHVLQELKTFFEKKRSGLRSKTKAHDQVMEVHEAQAGATVEAKGMTFDRVDALNASGAEIKLGEEGAKTKNKMRSLLFKPAVGKDIEISSTKASNAWNGYAATSHHYRHTFYPTQFSSQGPVDLDADEQNWSSVRAEFHKPSRLKSRRMHFGADKVRETIGPVASSKGLTTTVTSGYYEHGLRNEWALKAPLEVIAEETIDGYAPAFSCEAEGSLKTDSEATQTMHPFILNSGTESRTSGISGIGHVDSKTAEEHPSGTTFTYIAEKGPLHMESKKGDIDIAAPIMICPNSTVTFKAKEGLVILRQVELHHEIKTVTTSVAIKAMALDLAPDIMKGRFKAAAAKMQQAFLPVIHSMGAFLKSRSSDEAKLFTGMQAVFDAYQLFDTLGSGNFIDGILGQLATVSIGVQNTKSEQHFTQLLLPFIQANRFVIEAKNMCLEGLSGVVSDADFLIKNDAEIKAGKQESSFKQSSKGMSVGINLMNMTPSASANWSKAEGFAKEYVNAHLQVLNQLKMVAGNAVILKGALIEANQALITATQLHVESLQNESRSSSKSGSASTGGSVSASKTSSERTWTSGKTGINANQLYANIRKSINLISGGLYANKDQSQAILVPVAGKKTAENGEIIATTVFEERYVHAATQADAIFLGLGLEGNKPDVKELEKTYALEKLNLEYLPLNIVQKLAEKAGKNICIWKRNETTKELSAILKVEQILDSKAEAGSQTKAKTIEFLDTGTGYQIITKQPGYIRAETIYATEREDKEKTTSTNINLNVGGFMPKMSSLGGQKPGANTAATASSGSAGSATAPHAAAAKPGEAPKAERDPLLKGSASFSRTTSTSSRTAYANIGASVAVDADKIHGPLRRDATAFSETKKEEHFEGVFIPLMDMANAKEKIKRDYTEFSKHCESFIKELTEQAEKIAAKFRSEDDLEADEEIVINGKEKTRIKLQKDGKTEAGSKEKTKPKNKTKSDFEPETTETFDDSALDEKKANRAMNRQKAMAQEKKRLTLLKEKTTKILAKNLKKKAERQGYKISDEELDMSARNCYEELTKNKKSEEIIRSIVRLGENQKSTKTAESSTTKSKPESDFKSSFKKGLEKFSNMLEDIIMPAPAYADSLPLPPLSGEEIGGADFFKGMFGKQPNKDELLKCVFQYDASKFEECQKIFQKPKQTFSDRFSEVYVDGLFYVKALRESDPYYQKITKLYDKKEGLEKTYREKYEKHQKEIENLNKEKARPAKINAFKRDAREEFISLKKKIEACNKEIMNLKGYTSEWNPVMPSTNTDKFSVSIDAPLLPQKQSEQKTVISHLSDQVHIGDDKANMTIGA